MSSRIVHADCLHYRGSMPCKPHKATGQLCEDCPHYRPLEARVLIVKLGAMGDVLRTTALLPDIAARHERPHVTWLTRAESVDLLAGNPLIQRIVTTEEAGVLSGAQFDAVYALDSGADALAYAGAVRASEYHGFVAGKFGTCTGVAPGGDPTLYEIGLWDDLKRANRRPYLQMLGAAAGVTYGSHRPHVTVDPRELRRAEDLARDLPRPLIGVNTDAGDRWERKNWNPEYVEAFVRMARADGAGVFLFGGAPVRDRNRALAATFPGVAAFESAGNVRRLIAGIAQCDVLLTGDTLAMHIGWALEVPMVVLFGPTSLHEIELGDSSVKMAADELPCLACYLKTCEVDPHCMDLLKPQDVYAKVRATLRYSAIV